MEGRASAQSRRMVDRTHCVCVCVSRAGAQMPLGVCCACLRQCPGRTGVPRCACGPHVCTCARPCGLQPHCTCLCGHAGFRVARVVTALPTNFPQWAEGRVAEGLTEANTLPLEGSGSPSFLRVWSSRFLLLSSLDPG